MAINRSTGNMATFSRCLVFRLVFVAHMIFSMSVAVKSMNMIQRDYGGVIDADMVGDNGYSLAGKIWAVMELPAVGLTLMVTLTLLYCFDTIITLAGAMGIERGRISISTLCYVLCTGVGIYYNEKFLWHCNMEKRAHSDSAFNKVLDGLQYDNTQYRYDTLCPAGKPGGAIVHLDLKQRLIGALEAAKGLLSLLQLPDDVIESLNEYEKEVLSADFTTTTIIGNDDQDGNYGFIKYQQQAVIFLLIFGRWFLPPPSGHNTRQDLANMLTALLGVGADTLDLFSIMRYTEILEADYKIQWWCLHFLWFSFILSMLQFPLTMGSPPTAKDWCNNELIPMVINFICTDLPFLLIRLVVVFYLGAINPAIIFYMIKNLLMTGINLIRCCIITGIVDDLDDDHLLDDE